MHIICIIKQEKNYSNTNFVSISQFRSTIVQETLNVSNESECGTLETIVMHRPGDELNRLREDNLDQLLYDEIPHIDETHKSHDIFKIYV